MGNQVFYIYVQLSKLNLRNLNNLASTPTLLHMPLGTTIYKIFRKTQINNDAKCGLCVHGLRVYVYIYDIIYIIHIYIYTYIYT